MFCLKVLNLSRNALGVEGMTRLRRFLVKASQLTHLDLGECHLGPTGAQIVSDVFMCIPLHSLSLAQNGIGTFNLLVLL